MSETSAGWAQANDRPGEDQALTAGDRVTAIQYLAWKNGLSAQEVRANFARDLLLELGRKAAQLAHAMHLQAVKVRDASGYMAHTWPLEVWEKTTSGQTAPARPASQRQVAYVAFLAAERYGVQEGKSRLLAVLDNEMSEEKASELIQDLGGSTSPKPVNSAAVPDLGESPR